MQFLTVFLQNSSCKWSIFTRTCVPVQTELNWLRPAWFHRFFWVFFFMEWSNCNWKSGFFWSSPVSVWFFSGSMDWTFKPYPQALLIWWNVTLVPGHRSSWQNHPIVSIGQSRLALISKRRQSLLHCVKKWYSLPYLNLLLTTRNNAPSPPWLCIRLLE